MSCTVKTTDQMFVIQWDDPQESVLVFERRPTEIVIVRADRALPIEHVGILIRWLKGKR